MCCKDNIQKTKIVEGVLIQNVLNKCALPLKKESENNSIIYIKMKKSSLKIKKLKLNKEIVIDLKSKTQIMGKGTQAKGCGTFCLHCECFY